MLAPSRWAVGHFDPGVAVTEVWFEKWPDAEGTETDPIAGDDYRRDTDTGKTHFSSGSYRANAGIKAPAGTRFVRADCTFGVTSIAPR